MTMVAYVTAWPLFLAIDVGRWLLGVGTWAVPILIVFVSGIFVVSKVRQA
jgi:hypothetical protein